jgi:hypothetical protein
MRAWSAPSRRELAFVAGAVVLGIALRLAYVLATQGHTLAGDEIEYDIEGRFAAAGQFLWSTTPTGEPHASMWKTPGYSAWVGLLYALLGRSPDRVMAVQAVVFAPITIGLSWALARRLFTPAAGMVTAALVAVYPNAWQFDVRLYAEVLATPLTLLVLLAALTAQRPGWRRAALTGVALGALVLVKPSGIALAAPVAVMWLMTSGLRTGALRLAATLAVAGLVVAPWVVRNYTLDSEHFVPLSVQGAANYGVFNDDSANDRENPWAWRPVPRRDRALFASRPSEGELYHELNRRGRAYLADHPTAFVKALYYNGVTRLWDLRPPEDALREVSFQGRTREVAIAGLAMYWPLLALALAGLVGLWRARRREIVVAVLALAAVASVLHVSVAVTRYRAVYEPLVVTLAASVLAPGVVRVARRVRARRDQPEPSAVASTP